MASAFACVVSLHAAFRAQYFNEDSKRITESPRWIDISEGEVVNPEAFALAKKYMRIIELDRSLTQQPRCLLAFLSTYIAVIGIKRREPILNFEESWAKYKQYASPKAIEFFEKYPQCAFFLRAKTRKPATLKEFDALVLGWEEARRLCFDMSKHIMALEKASRPSTQTSTNAHASADSTSHITDDTEDIGGNDTPSANP